MLEREWVGRRVVVRRVVGVGAEGRTMYSDALGDLLSLDASTAVIETRAGAVSVPLSGVRTARLVEPSPGAQLALEAVAARGWRPAEIETSPDGWLLRADGGWTGRANSALALRTVTRPLEDVLADVSRWYARRGLPARIAVPLPAGTNLDAALGRRRWRPADDSHVLVARLDLLGPALAEFPGPADAVTTILDYPDADWLTSYHYRGATLPANAPALLTRHERVAFATVRSTSGAVLGSARGVVDDGWLGVAALEVDPGQRRRGVAGLVMSALTDWGTAQGAMRCYLQVQTTNTPALALYRRVGFHRHHSYRYWIPPTI